MLARRDLPLQAVALLLLAACAGTTGDDEATCSPRTVPLATSDRWRITTAQEDPFEDRPATIDCIPQTVTVEGPALEIDTAACDYVTVVQPTATAARACDVFRATLAHSPLFFDEPAEAHVALYVGSRALFDRRIAIPADAEVYEVEEPVGEDVPAGTPIYFHLHNHGSNDWFVTDVRLEP